MSFIFQRDPLPSGDQETNHQDSHINPLMRDILPSESMQSQLDDPGHVSYNTTNHMDMSPSQAPQLDHDDKEIISPMRPIKAELVCSFSEYPLIGSVSALEDDVKLEPGLMVSDGSGSLASAREMFLPGELKSMCNMLSIDAEDFKCFTCSLNDGYSVNDMFSLKTAMCMDTQDDFCCPCCSIKLMSPTLLEVHLRMHCLTGDGVNVSCVSCNMEHVVLLPPRTEETIIFPSQNATPKKRGRPRELMSTDCRGSPPKHSNNSTIKTPKLEIQENESYLNDAAIQKATPKKRGRSCELPSTGRRGRPPKHSIESTIKTPELEININDNSFDDAAIQKAPPEKRGRSRKRPSTSTKEKIIYPSQEEMHQKPRQRCNKRGSSGRYVRTSTKSFNKASKDNSTKTPEPKIQENEKIIYPSQKAMPQKPRQRSNKRGSSGRYVKTSTKNLFKAVEDNVTKTPDPKIQENDSYLDDATSGHSFHEDVGTGHDNSRADENPSSRTRSKRGKRKNNGFYNELELIRSDSGCNLKRTRRSTLNKNKKQKVSPQSTKQEDLALADNVSGAETVNKEEKAAENQIIKQENKKKNKYAERKARKSETLNYLNSRKKRNTSCQFTEKKDTSVLDNERRLRNTCDVCGKCFSRSASLTVHMRSHTEEKDTSLVDNERRLRNTCDVCGKSFSRSTSLTVHMRSHTGEKPYLCEICGHGFTSSSQCRTHQTVHNDKLLSKKELACPICGQGFNRKDRLKVHMRSHTGERPYICEICGKGFFTMSHLRSHQPNHREVKDIPCPVCNKMFTCKERMRKHQRMHRNNPKQHPCEHCGRSFIGLRELHSHLISHGDNRYAHVCNVCGSIFTRRFSLNSHMRLHTGTTYACQDCPRRYSTMSRMRRHSRKHHGSSEQAINSCTKCEKVFTSQFDLRTHMKIHTKHHNFKCDICSKSFLTKSHLVSHMRGHTGVKAHKCEKCGKDFNLFTKLKLHMRMHIGDRPHCCHHCGKAFYSNVKLREHIRIHTGEKPFSCSMCDKTFCKKSSRDTHLRVHTGLKPCQCENCGRSFSNMTHLNCHKLTHLAKTKPCPICGKLFPCQTHVKRHVHRKHKKEMPSEVDKMMLFLHSQIQDGLTSSLSTQDLTSWDATHIISQLDKDVSDTTSQLDKDVSDTISQLDKDVSDTTSQLDGDVSDTTSQLDGDVSDTISQLDGDVSDTTSQLAVDVSNTLQLDKAVGSITSQLHEDVKKNFVDLRRDHFLLTLTILCNFIKSHNDVIPMSMNERGTVKLLVKLVESTNKFVAHAATQCLIAWLNECRNQSEWLPQVENMVTTLKEGSTSHIGLINRFDALRSIFLVPKLKTPENEESLNNKRELVCSLLMPHCPRLIQKYIHTPHTYPAVVTHSFIMVWCKLVKFQLKTLSTQNMREVVRISTIVLEAVAKGQLPVMCFSKVIGCLTHCLPHSADLAIAMEVPQYTVDLAARVMEYVGEGLLEQVPLVQGEEVFGCTLYSRIDLQEIDGLHQSLCGLRKVLILILRASAVLIHSKYDSPGKKLVPVMGTLMDVDKRLRTVLQPKDPRSQQIRLSWLFDCCGDQDDMMIEALLCLTNSVTLLHKSHILLESVTQQVCSRFEPHQMFFLFLSTHLTWDDSTLLDLLTSPETCILAYLVRYLRYMLHDWDRFIAACQHFTGEFPLLLLSDSGKNITSEFSTTKSEADKTCVERVMTLFKHLRMKMEYAQSKRHFDQKFAPLIELFEQCESLYERR